MEPFMFMTRIVLNFVLKTNKRHWKILVEFIKRPIATLVKSITKLHGFHLIFHLSQLLCSRYECEVRETLLELTTQ